MILIAFAFILVNSGFCSCELSVSSWSSPYILPLFHNGSVSSKTFLSCQIEPSVTTFTTTWRTPNGVRISVSGFGEQQQTPDNRISVQNRPQRANSPQDSLLLITMLSYLDAGRYTCMVNANHGEEFGSATAELLLLVRLSAIQHRQVARINQEASLSCEMSWYIRRDSDFRWRIGDQIITESEKYGITYSASEFNSNAQMGLRVAARISTLTVFNVESSDVQNYTCFVAGTEVSATIQLTLDLPSVTTATTSLPGTASSVSTLTLVIALIGGISLAGVFTLAVALLYHYFKARITINQPYTVRYGRRTRGRQYATSSNSTYYGGGGGGVDVHADYECRTDNDNDDCASGADYDCGGDYDGGGDCDCDGGGDCD